MTSNGYANPNRHLNGSNASPFADGVRYSHRPKVLTVDEALPLTPFTSIVPFNSGRFVSGVFTVYVLNLFPRCRTNSLCRY
jgi:hypothetical protein